MPFPRLLVFDLDGTLIDSERDLTNAVNATLQEFGRHVLPASLIRTFIGDGAAMLVNRAFAAQFDQSTQTMPTQALRFFLEFYRAHKLDHTTTYPGVLDALATIRRTYPDTIMAILTNKPVTPSREICTGLGIADYFRWCVGGDSFAAKKPDPTGLLYLMSLIRPEPPAGTSVSRSSAEVVMIGDSPIDCATAAAAGIPFIACTYGLTPATTLLALRPSAVADSPLQWQGLCETLANEFLDRLSGSAVPSGTATLPATGSDFPE